MIGQTERSLAKTREGRELADAARAHSRATVVELGLSFSVARGYCEVVVAAFAHQAGPLFHSMVPGLATLSEAEPAAGLTASSASGGEVASVVRMCNAPRPIIGVASAPLFAAVDAPRALRAVVPARAPGIPPSP